MREITLTHGEHVEITLSEPNEKGIYTQAALRVFNAEDKLRDTIPCALVKHEREKQNGHSN